MKRDEFAAGARLSDDEQMAPVSIEHVERLRHQLGLPIELDTSGGLRREIRVRFVLDPERHLHPIAVRLGSDVRLCEALACRDVVARCARYNEMFGQLRSLRVRFASVMTTVMERGSAMSAARRALETLEADIEGRQFQKMGSYTVDVQTLESEIAFLEGYHRYLEKMIKRAEELKRMKQCGEGTLDLAPDASGTDETDGV
jgi:hypothetical protein